MVVTRAAIILILTAPLLVQAESSGGRDSRRNVAPESTASEPHDTRERDEVSNCAHHLKPASSLIAGKHRVSILPPRLPLPSKGEGVRDPVYGTCILRLTDHQREPPEGFARNYYSRFQPFNSDETRVLIYARNGHWHLYNPETLEHEKELDLGGGSVEPKWHPSRPEILFLLPNRGGLVMYAYDVALEKRVQVADFTAVHSIAGHPGAKNIQHIWPNAARIWTRWEGSPSMDGRYWAFLVETEEEEPLGLITFDLENNRILGTYDIRHSGKPDHVSMSPKGHFVVASWPKEAADCPRLRPRGNFKKPCGLMAFNRNLSRARGLVRNSSHSDMALDADGREVIVIANYESGYLEMIDLASTEITRLWRIYIDGASTALHVSGRAYNKPGWVLVSTYWTKDPENSRPWYENKLMAVELTDAPRILNIASIVSKVRTYFSEPHATVNRDFSKILFNANWGTGKDEDVDAYMVQLPEDSVPDAKQ